MVPERFITLDAGDKSEGEGAGLSAELGGCNELRISASRLNAYNAS
jgi:hypothetical protein